MWHLVCVRQVVAAHQGMAPATARDTLVMFFTCAQQQSRPSSVCVVCAVVFLHATPLQHQRPPPTTAAPCCFLSDVSDLSLVEVACLDMTADLLFAHGSDHRSRHGHRSERAARCGGIAGVGRQWPLLVHQLAHCRPHERFDGPQGHHVSALHAQEAGDEGPVPPISTLAGKERDTPGWEGWVGSMDLTISNKWAGIVSVVTSRLSWC